MAGLNANVTLGSGVAPIPSQINVPPASDEMSFGDAFAEAQASRQADARGAVQDPSWRPGPARPVSTSRPCARWPPGTAGRVGTG